MAFTSLVSAVVLWALFLLASSNYVQASTDTFGIPASSSLTSSQKNIPDWISIHKQGKEKLAHYLDLAKQRHAESIQKARDAYFSFPSSPGGDVASTTKLTIASDPSSFSLDHLEFDEYDIRAAGSLPDFGDELERQCFVTCRETPLFTKQECQQMIDHAEEYFAGQGQWTSLPSGQYDVAGFWIKSIPACHEWFNCMVKERLFPLLAKKFPDFCPNMGDLVVDNAYLFKYTPETGRRTDVHTDSGCLSFTIALNGQEEYKGGGTWFEGLERRRQQQQQDQQPEGRERSNAEGGVIEMDVGQCTVRPGGVRHCGHAVTEGTRYIIGGFCMNNKKVEYSRMLMGLGSEETQKGNYKKAEEALETAIVLNPSFDGPYSHLANLLSKQGNTAKAQKVLEHCLEHVNSKGTEIAYSLGSLYLEKGDYDNVVKCMNICLAIDEGDADAMMAMAQACAGKQDNAGEEGWYQKLVSTPGTSKDLAGKAYCNLGVLHAGSPKEIEYYEKSLALAPGKFAPNYSLACSYASKQDWDPAIVTFRKAIDVAKDGSDDEKQAVQNLYRCVMGKLQRDNPSGASSREEMMQRFVEIMGKENFEKLSSMRQA